MVYRGHVENGVIQLADSVILPEGAEVRVEMLTPAADSQTVAAGLSLYDRLRPVIGAAKGLPADLAKNHDHYLHGQAKQ